MTGEGKDIGLTIDFEPIGRRVSFSPGTTIFETSRDAGIELVSLCGGIGSCDSCRVKLVSGELSHPTIDEEALFSEDELKDLYSGWESDIDKVDKVKEDLSAIVAMIKIRCPHPRSLVFIPYKNRMLIRPLYSHFF